MLVTLRRTSCARCSPPAGCPRSAPNAPISRSSPTERGGRGRRRAEPTIYDWRLFSPYTIDLAVALARRLQGDARLRLSDRFCRAPRRRARPWSTALTAIFDAAIGHALDAGFVVGLAADHGMRAKTGSDGAPKHSLLDHALAAAGVEGARTPSVR